jgi:hypothetical protein
MKILLDHNTPLGVRRILANHDAHRAAQMGWATLSNTNLFDAAERAGFEIFITCDQNIAFQQNLSIRRIAIVVLMTNRWNDIRAQPQTVQHAVNNAMPGTVITARFMPQRGSRAPPDPKS